MRLLYVALTRAADRLIVSGVAPKPKKDGSDPRPENSWHLIVEQAMARVGAEPVEAAWGTSLAYGSSTPVRAAARRARAALPPVVVPDWARSPVPPEERPPGRWRRPQSPWTTKPPRRPARGCARQRNAES